MRTTMSGRAVRTAALAAVAALALTGTTLHSAAAATPAATAKATAPLTAAQRAKLHAIAADTWKFSKADVDPATNLPMDNFSVGADAVKGTYTSPTNIGVNLWSIIDAADLHLISKSEENQRLSAALTAIEGLQKWNGFLLSWYDTTTGEPITGPGGTSLAGQDLTGQLISTVDNGWYAAGLIELREAAPQFAARATKLLDAMDFNLFYDAGDQATDPNAGQMYGGWLVNQGNAGFEYGMLNTETRISAYVGIGTKTMPSDVWWRTWRTMPAQYGQKQVPTGDTVNIKDPVTGKQFPVVEGHYTSNGVNYVPSWGGSMFEALMPNLVVPEVADAPQGFGANDQDYLDATIKYDTQTLGYKVWGLSPSSTPDDTGGYSAYGSQNLGTDASTTDYQQGAVTPHASFLALDVEPQAAYDNITTLLADYPQVYGPDGFYDALDPTTGAVGHRYLVLDQAMILTALNNALDGDPMQHRWSADQVGKVDSLYLRAEKFSVAPERK
jgi:hypothetical protein